MQLKRPASTLKCAYVCSENRMARPYTMKRRAEKQAETRRRIVEATVNLHSSVGPVVTNTSMVA